MFLQVAEMAVKSAEKDQSTNSLLTAYRYAVGILVPVLVLIIGIVGKKVARGMGWERTDLYVGNELTLAGVSGSIVNVFDLLKPEKAIDLYRGN